MSQQVSHTTLSRLGFPKYRHYGELVIEMWNSSDHSLLSVEQVSRNAEGYLHENNHSATSQLPGFQVFPLFEFFELLQSADIPFGLLDD